MGLLSKILGDPTEKFLKKAWVDVEKINFFEENFSKFSAEELKQKTFQFKERLSKGETLDDILPEAFALVREGAKRTLNQRHFDVQLIGAMVLHQGKIAEMKTGEGKTLTSTLAVYLNALGDEGVHVVTVNDYLAKRDSVWMGQIYNILGLSVGCIVNDASFLYDEEYEQKISNNEFLISKQIQKSNVKNQKDEERDIKGSFKVEQSFLKPCQRKEAYTADITYGTNNEFGFDYLRDNLVFNLEDKVQRDFNFAIVDEIDSILIDEARTPLIISQPDLESSVLYKDFSKIVPKLKEPVDYNLDEKLKTASLTEEGINKIENILGVENIYESKGIKYLHFLEQSLRAMVFFQKDKDYIVKDGQIIIIDEFTGRMLPGRRYSGGLHQAIEAKEKVEVQPESKILATITFQNYFRFYKKLSGMTGTALSSAEEFDKVYKLMVVAVPTNKKMIRRDLPDLIYKTEKAKFKAVVEIIKAKQKIGQPVLVGTKSVEKNEYLKRLLEREGVRHEILNAKNHEREGEIIAQAGKKGAVTVATNMAGRGVDIMLGGVPPSRIKYQVSNIKNNEEEIISEQYKQWEKQRDEILALGGLCVVGTERHEARRIDDQLRGRAGRQGDPGSSQFFVSLEDDLMRIFGGDRLKAVMNTLKVDENQPIQAGIISRAIEKAQIRVEGFNFDGRKHVLEYDDVISKHRNAIYSKREDILKQNYDELKENVLLILKKELEKITSIYSNSDTSQTEAIIEEIKTIFPLSVQDIERVKVLKDGEEILKFLSEALERFYLAKEAQDGKESFQKLLKFICLRTIDFFWTEHLVSLDYLKESVGLRAYGGRDPLVEYKSESHKLFRELQDSINAQISRTALKVSMNK
ncbi:MAG: preprotein translocase subunit SecA [Candidatus Pacebacteria bacterium]|nr:preprotein translocase subunit SecA [Candidatus Paceibacterota bacterium]